MVSKLLILLLVPCLCFGQVYTVQPRLDSLQLAVLSQLNLPSTGSSRITLAVTTRAINRAYGQTCQDYPAYELTDTVVILKSDTSGSLPADFLRLRQAFKLRGDTLRLPMKIVDPTLLDTIFPAVADNIQKKTLLTSPLRTWTHARTLFVHPKYIRSTAGTTDTFLVLYYAAGTALSASTDSVKVEPEYIERIIHYACKLLSATRRNFDDAAWYATEYDKGLRPPKPRELELKP